MPDAGVSLDNHGLSGFLHSWGICCSGWRAWADPVISSTHLCKVRCFLGLVHETHVLLGLVLHPAVWLGTWPVHVPWSCTLSSMGVLDSLSSGVLVAYSGNRVVCLPFRFSLLPAVFHSFTIGRLWNVLLWWAGHILGCHGSWNERLRWWINLWSTRGCCWWGVRLW